MWKDANGMWRVYSFWPSMPAFSGLAVLQAVRWVLKAQHTRSATFHQNIQKLLGPSKCWRNWWDVCKCQMGHIFCPLTFLFCPKEAFLFFNSRQLMLHLSYYTKSPALHDGGEGAFSPQLPSQGLNDIKRPSILFTVHFDVLTFDFWLLEHSRANSPKRDSMLQEENYKVKRKSCLSHSCRISSISTKCGVYISPGSGPKNCDTS